MFPWLIATLRKNIVFSYVLWSGISWNSVKYTNYIISKHKNNFLRKVTTNHANKRVKLNQNWPAVFEENNISVLCEKTDVRYDLFWSKIFFEIIIIVLDRVLIQVKSYFDGFILSKTCPIKLKLTFIKVATKLKNPLSSLKMHWNC